MSSLATVKVFQTTQSPNLDNLAPSPNSLVPYHLWDTHSLQLCRALFWQEVILGSIPPYSLDPEKIRPIRGTIGIVYCPIVLHTLVLCPPCIHTLSYDRIVSLNTSYLFPYSSSWDLPWDFPPQIYLFPLINYFRFEIILVQIVTWK